jgi:hypothetical protein
MILGTELDTVLYFVPQEPDSNNANRQNCKGVENVNWEQKRPREQ